MVWKAVGALERTEKQAWLCGFLSPCQDPAQLPLPLAAAAYGNLTAGATSAIAAGRAAGWDGGSFPSAAHQCLGIRRRKQDALENVSSVVSCTDGFPSFPSLCCAVLQLKLQQRRTREELVSQGIMPRKYHFILCPAGFLHVFWWGMVPI